MCVLADRAAIEGWLGWFVIWHIGHQTPLPKLGHDSAENPEHFPKKYVPNNPPHTAAPNPPQDVFDLIDKHFAAWAAEQALNARLEERAQQFRSVQKRLLVRFKVGAAFQRRVAWLG